MDAESHLLDEHIFVYESPTLLHKNEKVVGLLNLLILGLVVIYFCYNGLHLSLLTIFLVLLFFLCMLVNCILLGRILMRVQEQRVLSGQPDEFHEYVERLNNPLTHEKFATGSQRHLFGIRLPSFLQNRPAYV